MRVALAVCLPLETWCRNVGALSQGQCHQLRLGQSIACGRKVIHGFNIHHPGQMETLSQQTFGDTSWRGRSQPKFSCPRHLPESHEAFSHKGSISEDGPTFQEVPALALIPLELDESLKSIHEDRCWAAEDASKKIGRHGCSSKASRWAIRMGGGRHCACSSDYVLVPRSFGEQVIEPAPTHLSVVIERMGHSIEELPSQPHCGRSSGVRHSERDQHQRDWSVQQTS